MTNTNSSNLYENFVFSNGRNRNILDYDIFRFLIIPSCEHLSFGSSPEVYLRILSQTRPCCWCASNRQASTENLSDGTPNSVLPWNNSIQYWLDEISRESRVNQEALDDPGLPHNGSSGW